MSRKRRAEAEPQHAGVLRPDLPTVMPCRFCGVVLVSPRFTAGRTVCGRCETAKDEERERE